MLRTRLASLPNQVDETRASLERLRQSGRASTEAVLQTQRRLQQLVEAGPRMQKQLERLEREQARDVVMP